MKRRFDVKHFLWVVLAGVILTGCSTPSTVESRKKERYDAYTKLSPDMRAMVDQGQITAGMNMDDVFIAWGKPEQVANGGSEAGQTVTWFYYGSYVGTTRYWGYRHTYYSYDPRTYIRAQATFFNGLVKQWQTFPEPAY
jgi:hypothetical protein